VHDLDDVSTDLHDFWRRWRRATGESLPAYVAVPEWGKSSGRLHLHLAVSWWDRLGAVEVCARCARPALRRVRNDIPPAGSFCIGCLWGLGFVGRPDAGITRPESVSAYCAKYLTKDIDEDGPKVFRRQRYRVGQGFQPEPVRLLAGTVPELVDAAVRLMGGQAPDWEWRSADVEGFRGPPCWQFGWNSG
jgi:hypothetical protein